MGLEQVPFPRGLVYPTDVTLIAESGSSRNSLVKSFFET